jgi:putative pyoverdin transport system ATP-binding/permease protein
MHLLRLLRTETSLNLRRLIFMAAVAGLSNALVLALINAAAGRKESDDSGSRLAIMFAVVLCTYTVSQLYLMSESAREIERILNRVRTRLIDAILRSELPDIEEIGRTRIYSGVSQEIQYLAQSTNVLVMLAQMAILVVFTTIYLVTLSMTSFLLAVVFMAIAIAIYLGRTKKLQQATDDANAAEARLHELLTGVLDGFKELKLNGKRSSMLRDDVVEASFEAGTERARAKVGYAGNFVFTQNVFFLLLGTMVFLVPALSHTYGPVVVQTTTAVLFVFGPISGIVSSIPLFNSANTSAANIMELERLISKADRPPNGVAHDVPSFREIEFRNVVFTFEGRGEHPFTVGPINVVLPAGETVFISGGNGSGKSTFLRLLTGLYQPQSGVILLDGIPVTDENRDHYRALFSSVFSDYHLFRRLYGIDPSAAEEGPELLRQFELTDKATISGERFSTIDLSGGQRKRLALIVAIMERRPICVLDEWAADQDPIFRKKFYDELVAELKGRGITVVAVTHDDRYYERADRRMHMEEGALKLDERAPADV